MSRNRTHVDILPQLVKRSIISAEDADRALRLAHADATGHGPCYHLVKLKVIEPLKLVQALADIYKRKGIDITGVKVDDETLKLLPAEMIIEHRIVPVRLVDGDLYVAMADPTDIDIVDKLKFQFNGRVITVVADEYALEELIESRVANASGMGTALPELEGDDEVVEVVDDDVTQMALQEEIDAAPAVRIINHTLVDAVRRGASDIHFEFFENESRIRYRLDGALVTVQTPQKKYDRALISRLKVMSRLKIEERRIPQDGRTKFKVGHRVIDFRVSTLPTAFGEKIVLRILDKSAVSLDLNALGMEAREQDIIRSTILCPFGMVLVTGPTGSGKTTTLYSILSMLNRPEVNILTVEDPIEYDFPGINQVPVNSEIGRDFKTTLRAFLRQDPDIIMVGEMRDQETAEIGMRAALTGHLVLSTMHTNDSVSAVTRMQEMKLERFNIASAVKIVIAQRLVRKICAACKAPTTPDPELLRLNHMEREAKDIVFMRGTGCPECGNTGYKGRIGLFEIFQITDDIGDLIINGATTGDLRQEAVRSYRMQTLRMTGLQKVREGLTTIEEIVRHTTL